ncbi:MAG TPA: AAA family ATPase [Candidatus Dormibacteraeota bacterium]|nr:AAA family ATPase [Candidatus Dormibacteraeota bacterium]
MNRCPACGHENQPGARFCSRCGAAMPETASAPREERRLVTVVFADLVGFTSTAEQLDPEDVRALLSPFYAQLRDALQRYGGTVEKFIGDAVMALFGAPVAHEDDPERAVRAALAIRDWVLEQQGLQVRIGVNTGEALVALSARPEEGEGMASGDVVNTAARLQQAAPVNEILVGESTHRATVSVIDYREGEAVVAKGKSVPLSTWVALEPRARIAGDIVAADGGPIVGRERERRVLLEALDRARTERTPQLVTVVGIPGIGKSRLLAELLRTVREEPEIVLWRQGRSLPYGDGITFAALAEMVKAQCGILESDTAEQAQERLHHAVTAVIADTEEARWVEGHLRPLAGLSRTAQTSGELETEAFSAWRSFFEALAEQHPLTLVFEDLHWADDTLLGFIEYLVEWAGSLPLLVVCSTRPELLERRPGWAGGVRNATTLSLSPLSDEEIAQLIASVSGRPVMAAEQQQSLLVQAGGNPLFAVQFTHMLAERGDTDAALPETVHGVIAARLDTLPVEEKSLLQDAAVIGRLFWAGALCAVDETRTANDVERRLHWLERKEFVQRVRRPSMAGESEYIFLHVLVRDVAYGQIPRAARAEKHRSAAEWIAKHGRTEDHAETLAYHYAGAIELLRAAGRPVDDALLAAARISLTDAGDRAFALNALQRAIKFYRSALELSEEGSLGRARLLFKLGRSQELGGEPDVALLEQASAALQAADDRQTAAETEIVLTEALWLRGDNPGWRLHLSRARELAAGLPLSYTTTYVTSNVSRFCMLSGEFDQAIQVGSQALAMAEELQIGELQAHALNNIGVARFGNGDQRGIDDLERSIALSKEASSPGETCRAIFNLSSCLFDNGQLAAAERLQQEQIALASRIGHVWRWRFTRGDIVELHYCLGEWDRSLDEADAFIAEVEAGSPHLIAAFCYSVRARIRVARDNVPGALADLERALELASANDNPAWRYVVLSSSSSVLLDAGERGRAEDLLDELLPIVGSGGTRNYQSLQSAAWAFAAFDRGAELLGLIPDVDSPWVRAARSFAMGDIEAAAEVCESMSAVSDAARDRLWLGTRLAEQGHAREAGAQLERALAFYRTVGATRYIRQCEQLLAATA